MATRLTRNLKLRLSDGLSADSLYNLERLDALGAFYTVSSRDDILLRSRQDIEIDPRSPDLGGAGGGVLRLGSDSNSLSLLEILADQVTVNGQTLPDPDDILTAADLSGYEGALGNPASDGQVLKSLADGTRYWDTLSGLVASQNSAITWLPSDGTTFTAVHGYNAPEVEIQVYDPAAATYIGIESVDISDPNQAVITVLEAPTGDGYRVFIREILV